MGSVKGVAAFLRHGVMVVMAAVPMALLLSVATPPPGGRSACALAAGAHHVAVVVEHGGGGVLTTCVSFDSAQISGAQVMQLSGFEYATANFGGLGIAVCQIDHEPASYPPSCWTSSSPYWGMFVSHAGGLWAVARSGISSQQLSDGDALGWHYVSANGSGGPPPPPVGICGVPPPPVPGATPVTTPPSPTPTPTVSSPPTKDPTPTPGDQAAARPTPSEQGPSPPIPIDPSTPAAPVGGGQVDRGHPSGPAGPDLGWLAAAVGAGALIGLLIVRLLAQRMRP